METPKEDPEEIEKLTERLIQNLQKIAREDVEGEDGSESNILLIEELEEGVQDHPEIIINALKAAFGFAPQRADEFLDHQETMPGTPNSEGEGTTKITVYRTNKPGIFIGKYEYADGDVMWVLRPQIDKDEKRMN
jgi:hypothetical protein